MIGKADDDYVGAIEIILDTRQFIGGALRVDSDQQAPQLYGEICGRPELVRVPYRRHDNRVDRLACGRRFGLVRRKAEKFLV
jgi:hypothetical protein